MDNSKILNQEFALKLSPELEVSIEFLLSFSIQKKKETVLCKKKGKKGQRAG